MKYLIDENKQINNTAIAKASSVILQAKMEILSDLLEPYKGVIGTTASVAAYFHQLSGAVICHTIHKQQSTVGHSILPFLAGAMM